MIKNNKGESLLTSGFSMVVIIMCAGLIAMSTAKQFKMIKSIELKNIGKSIAVSFLEDKLFYLDQQGYLEQGDMREEFRVGNHTVQVDYTMKEIKAGVYPAYYVQYAVKTIGEDTSEISVSGETILCKSLKSEMQGEPL